jgi:hypothetical protein
MPQRTVSYVRDTQFAGRIDQAVGFVDGFEGRVFGLYSVDFGDYISLSSVTATYVMRE